MTGIREALTIEGMVGVAVVALLAFVKENPQATPDIPTRVVLAFMYVILSFVPIIGVLIMLRATIKGHFHAYDGDTIRLMRWIAISSASLVVAVGIAAGYGHLPGQQSRELKLRVATTKQRT